MRYAEVIGDPIAQSKSPIIHKYWLDRLHLSGDYRRTRVPAHSLADFFRDRRADPEWLGCNITIPHKEQAKLLVDRLDPEAKAVGAINSVAVQKGSLVGYNTDVDGVAAALDPVPLTGRTIALIGAGGAARAIIPYLARREAGSISLLVRNPAKAEALRSLGSRTPLKILPLEHARAAFAGAAAIVNASSLGMAGAQAMPASILQALIANASGAAVFDMVTTPARTSFLEAGEAGGGEPIDGITMLLGQAARAFELFFGAPAPAADRPLRDLLGTESAEYTSNGIQFRP